MTVGAFFAYARERHAVCLRRRAGQPWPWTGDFILRDGRFTNVYRELDRTTVWFRENVRDPMRNRPEVLLATVVFRWFNRISTGEALFLQGSLVLPHGQTAFEYLAERAANYAELARVPKVGAREQAAHELSAGVRTLGAAIQTYCGEGPYVTGAYTINTLSAGLGRTKLDGVLELIRQWIALHPDWRDVARQMAQGEPMSLQAFCEWCRSPCLGGFMTYEVACDLRHTPLLARAPDVLTWANLGPGAQRGLNRIHRPDQPVNRSIPPDVALEEMRALLALSRDAQYWPQGGRVTAQAADWPAWELREVEHTLCEFDKYERVRLGQGRPRGSAPRA